MIWKVLKHGFFVELVWLVSLVSLVLFVDATFADQRGLNPPRVIEVFTSAQYPIVESDAKHAGSDVQEPEVTVYEIEGIQSAERDLSINLPMDPQQSKQIALQRIQSLDAQTRSRMQLAAQGLAKAMQYGVDRYPAVVFDGEAVVYGVTDLGVILEQYRVWQTERRP